MITPVGMGSRWVVPTKAHQETDWLPDNALKAWKLSVRALKHQNVNLALKESHAKICGQHSGGRTLAYKWPNRDSTSQKWMTIQKRGSYKLELFERNVMPRLSTPKTSRLIVSEHPVRTLHLVRLSRNKV